MNQRTVFLLFLLLVGAMGCGASSETSPGSGETAAPPASSAQLIDPCSLLTQAEASEIMETESGPASLVESGNVMGMRICQWSPVGESIPGLIQISVSQTEAMAAALRAQGQTTEKLYHETKELMSGEAVAGFGDDAYWSGSDLTILKDGVQISVSAGSMAIVQKGEQGLPAAKKVAALVMPRLG